MSKNINEYIAVFDYIDQTVLVLSSSGSVISLSSFSTNIA